MTLFQALNNWIAALLPGAFWDWAEMVLGFSVAITTLAQRTISPRFKASPDQCWVDRITYIAGLAGLALLGMLGMMVFLDALLVRDNVPRSFAVIALSSYLLIQCRVVILSFLELPILRNTHLARRYGANVFYAKEYAELRRKGGGR